jgi:hypothetical protein
MKHPPKKGKEKRFIGTRRIFVLQCSQCQQTKQLHCNGASTWPPRVIIKKFTQAGWRVGKKSKDDVCPDCQHRVIASRLDLATKALTDITKPIITSNDEKPAQHFSQMLADASKLKPEEAKELVRKLQEQIPKKTRAAKPAAPEPMTNSDYEKWLDQF